MSEGWLLREDSLVDHFRIIRPIGRGGMAEVYLARDGKLGRKVALKIVRPEALGDREAIERFLFEARATARFNHPNIVTIYAVGEDDGRPYVALEYLEGESLRQRLERERPGAAEAMRIGLAVAQALREAHTGGILHRDLKPENVMLARDGRLRVLDFGLAGVVPAKGVGPESTVEEPADTGAGALKGTPAYMAPEQWEERETSGTTDVWALGVMLFEMVCGRRPFEEATAVKQALVVCGPEPAPPVDALTEVRADLARLIGACLQKENTERPTAGEVAGKLREMLSRDRDESAEEESPFRGLLPFDERHRHFFFGRDAELAAFMERLREQPVVPVVGASGAGKSSFVQAGVIPRLRERGPLVVIGLRPGSDPFLTLALRVVAARRQITQQTAEEERADEESADQLARQLLASPHLLNIVLHRLARRRRCTVLLFVDQLEELYTLVPDPEVRRAFMQALCAAADDAGMPVRAVCTLREEFLSRLAEGPGIREALSRITLLRSPGKEALLEILTRPLEAVGYRYDDEGLPGQMVQEVAGEVSCLPLIQFAGRMLWEGRDREQRLLRRAVYQEMGGVAGALAQHADGVLAGMAPGETRLARSMLLRLVTGEGTRRVCRREELLEGLGEGADEVLRRLTGARLLAVRQDETEEESWCELVHESLVASWGKLRRWVEESREELVFLGEIGQAADLWEKRGRRDDEVWTGNALRDAARAVEHCTEEVPSRIRRFLDAGHRKERRKTWGRRALYASLLVIMAAFALVFWRKERETGFERDRAQIARREAEAQRDRAKSAEQDTVAALHLAEENLAAALAEKARGTPTVHEALLYAAAALQKAERSDARGVLAGLLDRPRARLRWQSRPGSFCLDIRFSPDGETLACIGEGLKLIDPASGTTRRLPGERGGMTAVAWSPDGRRVAGGAWKGSVRLWEAATGQILWKTSGHEDDICRLGFTEDGSRLVSAGLDGSVIAWNASSGEKITRLEGTCEEIWHAAFAAEPGAEVAGCDADARYLWDVAARQAKKEKNKWSLHTALVPIAYTPDGNRAASWDGAHAVVVRDVRNGQTLHRFAVPDGAVTSLRFSPGGDLLAATCEDGVARIWDVSSGKEKGRLVGHGGPVLSLAWAPDGATVVTSGYDGTVRKWDAGRWRETARMAGAVTSARCVAPSPDGTTLFSIGQAGGHFLLDLETGRVRRAFGVPLEGDTGNHFRCAWSPAGDRLASVDGPGGRLHLWDPATGRLLACLSEHAGIPWGLEFTLDGKHLVTAATDRTIRLWDVYAQRHVKVIAESRGEIHSMAMSPDGARLMTSSEADGTTTLWDLGTGEAVLQTRGCTVQDCIAFSADGNPLVLTVEDGVARIRDAVSGEIVAELPDQQHQAGHLVLSPDGRTMAFGDESGRIHLWDLEQKREIARLLAGNFIEDLAFTPDGHTLLASGGPDCVVRVWDLENQPRAVELSGHTDTVTALAYAPDGTLMTAGLDHTIRSWDTESGREISTKTIAGLPQPRHFFKETRRLVAFEAPGSLCVWDTKTGEQGACLHEKRVSGDLAVSPDGRWIVAISQDPDYGVRLWSAETGEELELAGEQLDVFPTGGAFSPDGKTLVVGFPDMSDAIVLVDLATRTVRSSFDLTGGAIRFAFSPDSRLLAANTTWFGPSWDIRLLDFATGEVVQTLHGHENWVARMAFSPDGRLLASWSPRDETTRIWDVASGKELALLPTAGPMAFSPDGKRLATVGRHQKNVRLWNLDALTMPVDDLLEQVRRESGFVLDGLEIVPDPERMRTRFVPVDQREEPKP